MTTSASSEGYNGASDVRSEVSSPSAEIAEASPERRCRRCGALAVADENSCKACGSFLPGNTVQLVHGSRRRHPDDPEDSPLFAEWASDLGGDDVLSSAQRAVLCRAVEADRVCRTAFDYLAGTRETVTSDRVQRALSVLATHAGTLFRAAQMLGLERKARNVTVEEYVARKAAEVTQ